MKYPGIVVPLAGEDGNAFAIIGRATRVMRSAGLPADERERFQREAMSGDYDHLLRTVIEWFDTTPGEEQEDA